jgi:hypothetical protein
MKYIVEFRKEALQDILEAISWYEFQLEGSESQLLASSPILFTIELKIRIKCLF